MFIILLRALFHTLNDLDIIKNKFVCGPVHHTNTDVGFKNRASATIDLLAIIDHVPLRVA